MNHGRLRGGGGFRWSAGLLKGFRDHEVERIGLGLGGRVVAMFVAGMTLLSFGADSRTRAQESANPADEPSTVSEPLSIRYRLLERYRSREDPDHPEFLTQYQVGTRETIKVVREKAQGTPERTETSLESIYTERVAKVSGALVSEVVRRYDAVRFKTTMALRPFKTPWLEGLTVLYRHRANNTPEILSLTAGRSLRQQEFARITKQLFLPQLETLLPTSGKRVGDTWKVPRPAAQSLVGEVPSPDEYDLTAELLEVRKEPDGNSLAALIGVRGQCVVEDGPTAINARITFQFQLGNDASGVKPNPAKTKTAPTTPAAPRRDGSVDGVGFISKVRMTQIFTLDQEPDQNNLKQTVTRELVLDSRKPASIADPLPVPEPPPAATPSNSWLVYDDPQARFHFSHPQALRVARVYPDGVDLVDQGPDGKDVILIGLQPQTTPGGQRNRSLIDPAQQKKELMEYWKKRGEEVVVGSSEWLKDAEWAASNRKVYRIEAALRPSGGASKAARSGRIYLDRYLVHFGLKDALVVTAMTSQDPHLFFRNQAEELIKGFTFGSSDAPAPANPLGGTAVVPPG